MAAPFFRAGSYGVLLSQIVYYVTDDTPSIEIYFSGANAEGEKLKRLSFAEDEGAEKIAKYLSSITIEASNYKKGAKGTFVNGGCYAFNVNHVTDYLVDGPEAVTVYFDCLSEGKPAYLSYGSDESAAKIIQYLCDVSADILNEPPC